MQIKLSLKQSLFILAIAVVGVFLIVFLYTGSLARGSYNVISIPEQTSLGFPIRLKIPGINIDAAIENVGITPEGAMDAPKLPEEVAWYKLGSRPGEIGSAVIAGHSGYKDNKPAVFDNLHKLKKGDKIYVQDEKGTMTAFVVRKIKNYNPDADAGDVFGSNDGIAHLNFVTCTGLWNAKEKTHSQRLVVFTDKIME